MGNMQVTVRCKVEVPLKLRGGASISATIVSFSGIPDGREHFAVLFPRSKGSTPLVRLHSECLTGDVLGSAKCDCGEQLHEALERLSSEGGALLYLRQEGRGIGLYNKLEAYRLQMASDLDTFEANRALGRADDEREYRSAALMLQALQLTSIHLLTNNPGKVKDLEENGIKVLEVVPTGVFSGPHNWDYLRAKVQRTLHNIALEPVDQVGLHAR